MKAEVKQKWVSALRSGDYDQGKALLKDKNKRFCCLGVLCDLHAKETGNEWNDGEYLGNGIILPPEVMEWSGLTHSSGDCVTIGNDNFYLSLHNDAYRTFLEIADAAENQL